MLLKTIVDGGIGAMVNHWWKQDKKETGSIDGEDILQLISIATPWSAKNYW